ARKLLPAHICTPEAGRIALVDPRKRGPSPFASYGLRHEMGLLANACTLEAGRIALVDPRTRGPSPFASYGPLMRRQTHERHAEESQERDHENHGDHQRALARTDVPRQARMHGRGQREPGDEGPGLQWIPGPEAAPGILGPDGAGNQHQ